VKAFWNCRTSCGITGSFAHACRSLCRARAIQPRLQANNFWQAAAHAVKTLPGVESASIGSGLPPIRPVVANTTPLEAVDPSSGGSAANRSHSGPATPTIDY